LLTDDARLFAEDTRRSAAELAEGDWSFRDYYVGFKAGSAEALADVREFLRECALLVQ
jgi:hypothetical protein